MSTAIRSRKGLARSLPCDLRCDLWCDRGPHRMGYITGGK